MSLIKKELADPVLTALVLAVLSVASLFVWEGHVGLNLWDEGFLWYGAQRVMEGSVPIRDFMAYDPGRYYWAAALMRLFGDNGIVSLRIAVAVFEVLGLWVALLLVAQEVRVTRYRHLPFLAVSAFLFLVWAIPRHKLFDISLSLFLVGVLTFLIYKPLSQRYFFTGVAVGLVAFFGRNHGLYGALASAGVILWLNIKREMGPGLIKGVGLWLGGVMLGYLPMVFMVFFIQGFFDAFWASVKFLFEIKSTNLPLPIPWPWLVSFSGSSVYSMGVSFLVGFFFVGLLVFDFFALGWVFYRRFRGAPVSPALVASAFLAVPYTQFAYSRADTAHLAQSIFPLLVGCVIGLSTQPKRFKWPLILLLSGASVWAMYSAHPGSQCGSSRQCVVAVVSGDRLELDPSGASDVAMLERNTTLYADHGRNVLVTPFWPGAYSVLGRVSPVWEIYALFPRPEAFEMTEIERIKASAPGFVMVVNLALDGNEALRFKNTHPLTYRYITDAFERVPYPDNPAYEIYKAK